MGWAYYWRGACYYCRLGWLFQYLFKCWNSWIISSDMALQLWMLQTLWISSIDFTNFNLLISKSLTFLVCMINLTAICLTKLNEVALVVGETIGWLHSDASSVFLAWEFSTRELGYIHASPISLLRNPPLQIISMNCLVAVLRLWFNLHISKV